MANSRKRRSKRKLYYRQNRDNRETDRQKDVLDQIRGNNKYMYREIDERQNKSTIRETEET